MALRARAPQLEPRAATSRLAREPRSAACARPIQRTLMRSTAPRARGRIHRPRAGSPRGVECAGASRLSSRAVVLVCLLAAPRRGDSGRPCATTTCSSGDMPEQVGVQDQVVRVLVVPVVVDVVADVVQQRRVGQNLAVAGRAARAARRSSRTAAGRAAAPAARAAPRSGSAPRTRAPIGLALRPGRRSSASRARSPAAALRECHTPTTATSRGSTRASTSAATARPATMMSARAGLSPGTVSALLERHVLQRISSTCSTSTRGIRVPCTVRAARTPCRREINAGEVRERPARSDHLRAAPVAQRHAF